ncbi:hypothetical protein B0H17DRAFT_1137103 [Mycena rosella]|uniref:Uncharacterized protein n=1 Tax=Mycena rosella TaxID=1033263 RepID=A0AAD7D9D3_MYCRO|nr:hypothetical protein B0H17DRAFT_1137103 [Mycena rosella]
MFRKFSKSSAPFQPLHGPHPSASESESPAPNSGDRSDQPWPRRRLQTASDSNLPASRKNAKDKGIVAPLKSGGTMKESRPRRSTIVTSGPNKRPAVSSSKNLPVLPSNARIGRKIVEYMPELYEEVDPIRVTGQFYTWEDPSWLKYVPLPPAPRKNVKFGRVLSKPKQGPDVCS